MYEIKIAGVDRTADVVSGSVVIRDAINDAPSTCTLRMFDLSGLGIPNTDDTISITIPGSPTVTRTNLVQNPSFENALFDWWTTFTSSSPAPVRSRDTTVSYTGSASFKIDANGVNTDAGLLRNITLDAGTYFLSAYVKTQNITGDAKVVLRNTVNFQPDINLTINTPTQNWTRLSGSITVPPGGKNFDLLFGLGPYGTPSKGIAWFDAVMLEKTDSLGNYFDGDDTDARWSGTPHNSISEYLEPSVLDVFAGNIQTISYQKQKTGGVMVDLSCVDYTWLFDSNLVHRSYENMTDAAIISDIVTTYCAGHGFTTNNVQTGVTISQISFNYLQPSQCMRKICEVTGRNWYVDYNKDVHYFALNDETSPVDISNSSTDIHDLRIRKDSSQLKNRVYVRGGTKLSDFTTYEEKGDGQKRIFVLPEKPHDVTVKVNNVTKTLGIKNIDTSGFDWYLNYQEKYLEQDTTGTTLTSSDTLQVSYKYNIPILVALEDSASIIANGAKEFAIFDRSIETTQAARDRASAELTDYANDIVEGSFSTYTHGWRAGQTVHINRSDYGINADYIVQRVTLQSVAGGVFRYDVQLASSKTMGVIKLLIELLERNKNEVTLDTDEVVDELLQISENLLADSLTDSLIVDSTAGTYTWAAALDTSITRLRWNLGSWKP